MKIRNTEIWKSCFSLGLHVMLCNFTTVYPPLPGVWFSRKEGWFVCLFFFFSLNGSHSVSLSVNAHHIFPIHWPSLWSLDLLVLVIVVLRRGTVSHYVLHKLEPHRSPKGPIPRERCCQVICWWVTSDFSFQLRMSFLVSNSASGTIVGFPRSFVASVMRLRQGYRQMEMKTETELWERLKKGDVRGKYMAGDLLGIRCPSSFSSPLSKNCPLRTSQMLLITTVIAVAIAATATGTMITTRAFYVLFSRSNSSSGESKWTLTVVLLRTFYKVS